VAIPQRYLQELRVAGLLVLPSGLPADHPMWPEGWIVIKPKTVGGNGHPVFEYEYPLHQDPEDELNSFGPIYDAPIVTFHVTQGRWWNGVRWFVSVRNSGSVLEPGEFVNDFGTPEEAVADILDFYFGSPERMAALRQATEEKQCRGAEDSGMRARPNMASLEDDIPY
jgi:hypothetical protein